MVYVVVYVSYFRALLHYINGHGPMGCLNKPASCVGARPGPPLRTCFEEVWNAWPRGSPQRLMLEEVFTAIIRDFLQRVAGKTGEHPGGIWLVKWRPRLVVGRAIGGGHRI